MKLNRYVKDVLTFIGMALIGLILIGLIEANRAEPAEPSHIQRIATYIYNNSPDRGPVDTPYEMDIQAAQLDMKIKLLPYHDDYWWEWDEHSVYVWWTMTPADKPMFLRFGFTIKHYLNSASFVFRNLTVWWFVDFDCNGEVDSWSRDFNPELSSGEVIFPSYPKGFRTKSWSKPNREIAQAYFDEVVAVWLKHIEKLENNGANN